MNPEWIEKNSKPKEKMLEGKLDAIRNNAMSTADQMNEK